MSRFLQPETVGDLREGEEVRQFLLALPQAAKSVKVVKGTAPPSVSSSTQIIIANVLAKNLMCRLAP
jgi:hypothetical protein